MDKRSGFAFLENLSFFVENSDELRFYPTNMEGTKTAPEEVALNNVSDIPDLTIPAVTIPAETSPVAGRKENILRFESVLSITIILALY